MSWSLIIWSDVSAKQINMNKRSAVSLFFVLAMAALFLYASGASAQNDNGSAGLRIFDDQFVLKKEVPLVPSEYTGTVRFVLADVDADKVKEIVVGYGGDGDSLIKIFRANGVGLAEWRPFGAGFAGEISLTAIDLNGDGRDEVVAGAGAGGGPQVRLFDGQGKALPGGSFWAREKEYRSGVEVGVGDVNGDGQKEIVVSSIDGKNSLINFFDQTGEKMGEGFTVAMPENSLEPVHLGALDLGSDGIEEVVVGNGAGNEPKVQIYRQNGTLIKEFLAYQKEFTGGVNFQAQKINNKNVIVVGAGYAGGPHVRFFDCFGKAFGPVGFFAYDASLRGGINVGYGDVDGDGKAELVTLPQRINYSQKYYSKYIDIDISEQKLRYYLNGKLINAFLVSSGLKSMPTPLGEFTVWQKSPREYSSKYNLYMPWWMSFKPGYGLHELPEWPSGYKEGVNHLGQRVSHGCVRLGIGPAKTLYDWALIGTRVLIHE